MHARYSKEALGEDLVFRAAAPIVGGREFMGSNGKLEHGATSSGQNNFQGRYAIRHPWAGPIACKNPRRGVWGGPPGGGQPRATPAVNTAFVARGKLQLASFVKGPLPDVIALPGAATPLGSPVVKVPPSPPSSASSGGADNGARGQALGADAAAPASSASVVEDASAGDASGGSVPPVQPPPSCGCDVPGMSAPLSASGVLAGIGLAAAGLRRRLAGRRKSR
jgi:hypothetical protein